MIESYTPTVPELGKHREGGCKPEASLASTVSSRPASTTKPDVVSKVETGWGW